MFLDNRGYNIRIAHKFMIMEILRSHNEYRGDRLNYYHFQTEGQVYDVDHFRITIIVKVHISMHDIGMITKISLKLKVYVYIVKYNAET